MTVFKIHFYGTMMIAGFDLIMMNEKANESQIKYIDYDIKLVLKRDISSIGFEQTFLT